MIQEADKAAIRAIADKNPIAARIFVTGVVHKNYIGEEAANMLEDINNVFNKEGMDGETLYVHAKDGTVRMLRFEPEKVWKCFHPDLVLELVQQEADRLNVGIDPWKMEVYDFYEEMVRVLTDMIPYSVPSNVWDHIDIYHNAVYLASMLLFKKQGFLDIPVAVYFAQPDVELWMKNVFYRKLTAPEIGKLVELDRYKNTSILTNPEMHYVIDLYMRNKLDTTAESSFVGEKE